MASHREGYQTTKAVPAEKVRSGAEPAGDAFESIFQKVADLKARGDSEALHHYLTAIHEEHFASSDDLFNGLSLTDSFEMLMRVNKVDEMQGPIGQVGVNQLIYRLASFQYEEGDKSSEEIAKFIETLLKNKNISDTVGVLVQLQTIAANSLANGSWAEPVYEGILEYLKTSVPHEVFIISKVKERLSQKLTEEEEIPTMGVVTTLNNSHQALMFENEVFDAEYNSKVNEVFSFDSAPRVRISALSRDYSGIFDTRNRLVSLVPTKALNLPQTGTLEQMSELPSMDDFYETARFLNSRNHLFNKALYVFSKKILKPSQELSLTTQFAEILGIPVEELSAYIENEKQHNVLEKEGAEVNSETAAKSDQFFALMKGGGLDFNKFRELEHSLYEEFNKTYIERKNKRQPIETLDLTQSESLGFLGLSQENIELFKVLQDPYFTKAIQEVVGIKLFDLDMRAQSAFLNYLAKSSESDVREFSHLLGKFEGEDRVKICSAYLAFEDESYLSYMIENLCQRPKMALPVMSVVYDLIGNVGKIEDFLLTEFRMESERKIIASVYQKLIGEAKKILLHYNAGAMNNDTMGEIAYGTEMMAEDADFLKKEYGYSIDQSGSRMRNYQLAEQNLIEEAQQEAAKTNVNQVLFLNSFKSLKEAGVAFSLEDIQSSSFQEIGGSDISPEQINEMRVIYESNQSGNSVVKDELLKKFNLSIRDEKTRFYLFTYGNRVQSFAAFTPAEDGQLHASAFNVAPHARGYRIGEAMLYEAIDKVAEGHTLTADCDSKLPISAKYIETGWVATRYWDDHGDNILDIVRNDKEHERYAGKQLSADDIIAGRVPEGLVVKTASEQKDLPFALCNQGYVLTRMFVDPQSRQHYAVFESASPAHTA